MIRVEHLSKNYGPRVAVSDVTFSVQKGEILGFLGPNGAGKTTTMRMITGYLPPSGGKAEVAGYDVFTHSLKARQHIGYMPETVPLYPEMSVRDYLDFMAKIKGSRNRKTDVGRAMEKARINHRANDQIGKLSKGLRQRVGLAQALLNDPPVLVLDEPTSGLDPKQINETRNLIKALGGDHTVILSTHILPEVSATCSRVVIISNGRVVAEDTPENLQRRVQGAETLALTARGPHAEIAQALDDLAYVLSVKVSPGPAPDVSVFTVEAEVGRDVREALARTVVQGGWGLLELRASGLSLEDIFLQLVTSDSAASEVAA